MSNWRNLEKGIFQLAYYSGLSLSDIYSLSNTEFNFFVELCIDILKEENKSKGNLIQSFFSLFTGKKRGNHGRKK